VNISAGWQLFPLAVLLLVLIHRCQQGEQADAPQGE
jgi:hypothetical protein